MADHRANVTQYAHRLKNDSVHIYSLAMVPFPIHGIYETLTNIIQGSCHCIHKSRGWVSSDCDCVRLCGNGIWVLDHNRRFYHWPERPVYTGGEFGYLHLITALMVRSLTTETPQKDLISQTSHLQTLSRTY